MMEIKDIWLHAHRIIRSARQIINTNLRPLGIASAEGNILLHMLLQDREMGQEELVEQLDISKPAVSRAVDSLETKGFITRERNPADRRAITVRLTEKARETGPVIERVYNRLYEIAMRGVDRNDFTGFVRLFGRISENFSLESAGVRTED